MRTVDGKHQYTHTRDAIVSTEFLTNTVLLKFGHDLVFILHDLVFIFVLYVE